MRDSNIYNYTYQDKSVRAKNLALTITIAAIVAAGVALLVAQKTLPDATPAENLMVETTSTDSTEETVTASDTETPDEALPPVVLPAQEAP